MAKVSAAIVAVWLRVAVAVMRSSGTASSGSSAVHVSPRRHNKSRGPSVSTTTKRPTSWALRMGAAHCATGVPSTWTAVVVAVKRCSSVRSSTRCPA